MRPFIFLTISCIVINACQSAGSIEMTEVADEIRNADIAFSELSKNKGMRAAFLEYIDSSGVLLRPGHFPIVGKEAEEYLRTQPDTGFTLTWVPSDAIVAHSGELGYTYGLYTFSSRDTSFQGTYVSIWRRNNTGKWKFVLDTGNPGVGDGNK